MTEQHDVQFVSIYEPRDPIQAGMIRDALKQARVNCYVDNEITSSVRFGGMSIGAAAMSVMVREDQVDQAREIVTGLGFD